MIVFKHLKTHKFFGSFLKIAMAEASVTARPSEMHFKQVEKQSELFSVVKEELKKRALVYGNQDETLKKLEDGSDRTCELLLKDVQPVTLLIYKADPVPKTESIEVTNSLEVKTFLPIDKGSVNEYLQKTLDRAVEIAKEKKAENIHLTCSEREKPTFNFLINNKFHVCETWNGKYVDGVKEYLMYKSMKDIKEEESKSVDQSKEESKIEAGSSEENRKRKCNEEESCESKRGKYDDNRERGDQHRNRGGSRKYRHDNHQRQDYYQRPKNVDDSCTLMKKYVHYIKDGRKTVEGRLNVPMFQKWKEGMTIRFHYRNRDDDVFVKILKVKLYKSFKEMLEAEGVRNCIPELRTVDEGVRAYYNIPRYKEREHLGVLAFRLQKVNKPE